MQISTIVILGIVFGALAAGAAAIVLVATRSYRGARKYWAIKTTQVVVGGSVVICLVILLKICKAAGITSEDSRHSYALVAYTLTYSAGVMVALRDEFKWRKSYTTQSS